MDQLLIFSWRESNISLRCSDVHKLKIKSAVSLEKVIPAVRRVSCAPLSACLFSRLEERCSADCPYFVLTLWYLGNDVSVSFLFLCFMIFLFSLIDTSTEPLNRSQTRRLDKSVLGCNHQRTVSVFKRGFTFLRHPWHSKSKEYKKTKARLESICFLTEQH